MSGKIISPREHERIEKVDLNDPPDYLIEAAGGLTKARRMVAVSEVFLQLQYLKKREPAEGFDMVHHRLRLCRRLWPKSEMNGWKRHMIYAASEAIGGVRGRYAFQNVHFVGAQNSGKTDNLSELALMLLLEDPAYVRVAIGSPYRSASEEGVWARIVDKFRELVAMGVCVPMDGAGTLVLKDEMHKPSDGEIRLLDGVEEAGYLKVYSLDKVGKIKGRKPRDPGGRGGIFVIVDEASYFDHRAGRDLESAMANVLGQPNAMLLSAQNPVDPMDLGGRFTMPADKRGHGELDVEEDHMWECPGGWAFRYDGHCSPNVVDGKDIWKGITSNEMVAKMRNDPRAGEGSPRYLVEIRAIWAAGGAESRVLTMGQSKSGRFFDRSSVWRAGEVKNWAFCDTSLGGDDWVLLVAEARGEMESGKVVMVPVSMTTAPLQMDLTADKDLLGRLKAAGNEFGLKAGLPVPVEIQGALWTREMLDKWGVSAGRFGYDGSMRANIVRAMDAMCGSGSLSLNYDGSAPHDQRLAWEEGKSAFDVYANFASWVYFLLAEMVMQGHWRDGDGMLETALGQICSRGWKIAGLRKKIDPKEEWKAAHGGRSPDDGDAWAGLNYLCHLRGAFGEGEREGRGMGDALDSLMGGRVRVDVDRWSLRASEMRGTRAWSEMAR